MIVDAALIGLLIYQHNMRYAAWIVVLIALRRVPLLANTIARDFGLDRYHGVTAWIAHQALPAWGLSWDFMSRTIDLSREKVHAPVHVPVQGTAVVSAKTPLDRDIIIDQWIVDMAQATDEKGKELFSANDIFKAVGGHRAEVLARVKEVRTGEVAQFQQEDGGTAPATYPVTRNN